MLLWDTNDIFDKYLPELLITYQKTTNWFVSKFEFRKRSLVKKSQILSDSIEVRWVQTIDWRMFIVSETQMWIDFA